MRLKRIKLNKNIIYMMVVFVISVSILSLFYFNKTETIFLIGFGLITGIEALLIDGEII